MAYFYATQCPAAEDCSEQSFKQCLCWGHSIEECKQQVVRHLMVSNRHSMSKTDAMSQAARPDR